MAKPKSAYYYVPATFTIIIPAQTSSGIPLEETSRCVGVQIQVDAIGDFDDAKERAKKFCESQTLVSKAKTDNAAVKTSPFSNRDGQIVRHVIIVDGDANPEWVMAEGVKVVFAKSCDCGNRQGTCVNGTGGCLNGQLVGGTENE